MHSVVKIHNACCVVNEKPGVATLIETTTSTGSSVSVSAIASLVHLGKSCDATMTVINAANKTGINGHLSMQHSLTRSFSPVLL